MVGVMLVILAGILEGLFSMGITRTPKWKFENIWGVGSLIALVLVPWPLAFLTVPKLCSVYQSVDSKVLIITFLCGIGWGLGGIFWGKAIAAVGMALGVSLLMGFINVFGSIGPMVAYERHRLATTGGQALMGAVLVMIVGVVIMAKAGKIKEEELTKGTDAATAASPATPFAIGLIFCMLSGALSALVNFSFFEGGDIAKAAASAGAPGWAKGFAIWALVFTANYAVNFIYAVILMVKNKTAGLIFSEGKPMYWFWALFMGIAWPAGIAVFGIAADTMGGAGGPAYAAFPMMLLVSILTGNAAGALTGEWKGTSKRPRTWMLMGVVVLGLAFAVMGLSAKLTEDEKQKQAEDITKDIPAEVQDIDR
jgi:L-rhamnose-H+ transport protein